MSGARPVVALTASIQPEAGDHGRPAIFLYTSYVEALERAGVGAAIVTPAHGPESVRSIMDRVDGLVLSGGEDIDPRRYGETARVPLDDVFPARDELEFGALEAALRQGMPVLGICRGCQLLNVAFGGTLYQDIPTDRPGSIGHAQSGGWARRTHQVFVEPGSLLHEIVAERELVLNTFHHQAARDLGEGLRVVARAADGLIEALEAEAYPWVLGVQWHPERLEASAPDTDPDRRIFAAFAAAVARHAGQRA